MEQGGEVEQGGLGSGVAVAVFLVFGVVLVDADHPSVSVASDVGFTPTAGVDAGGELLGEPFIMTVQVSEDGDEGAVASGGDHVVRVFAGRGRPAR
ncbi:MULTISPECIES: hypothetical protein [Rhodococcus]|uniref:hypothetical protein n=1 Tax=Rhodococcus TaxID=1827 RepID=UPI000689034E|nr:MULTISPECIES: hypothetical protein [Rhodococcus]ORI22774.1 hypothetical protein BH686_02580 [Rhodococcus erythropolis]